MSILKKVLVLVAVSAMITLVVIPLAAAQDAAPITYERYDVALDIKPDGAFTVRETQQIRFDGEFSQAFAEIPLAYTTRIDAVQVYEGDTAYTAGGEGPGAFTTQYDGDSLYVDWTFTPTRPGDVRSFTLAYTVVGGLWIYPDQDLLEWRAVPADRSGVPALASRVIVTLPPDPTTAQPIPASDLRAASFGQPATSAIADGQVVFTSEGPIPDGVQLQVQVGFPHGLVTAEPQPWQVAEDTADLLYSYKALDADIAIGGDGVVTVEERHSIAVETGALRQGYHTFKHTGMDDVVDLVVSEGEQPYTLSQEACDYCYAVSQTPRTPGWVSYDPDYDTVNTDEALAGATSVVWTTPALVKGEETTFRLRYTLLGALEVREDAQVFSWNIVFDEQDVYVETASVRLHLPPGVEPADVQVSGATLSAEPPADGALLLLPEGPITSYLPWEFSVTLPAQATTAAKPRWQQDLEAAAAEAQQARAQRARTQVLLAGLALAILTGGLLSLLLIWYRWGRDEPVPLPAEYIPEPPSDLAPGIVAYLLDERPSTDGALASLFHLATLGLLRIQLTPQVKVGRNWNQMLSDGQTVETPDGRTVAVPTHLVRLFNELAPAIPVNTSRKLDELAGQFQAALPGVYECMGKEVRPLFADLPDKARRRWRILGQGIVLLGAIALFPGCASLTQIGVAALTPGLALVAVGVAWSLGSRWMPQRSSLGAAEAAKWRAFRRYLLHLEDYGNQAEAQEVLDRYFAYAVAMDVQDVVLRDAESLRAHVPVWTRPMVITARDDDQPSASRSWRPLSARPAPLSESAPAAGQPAASGVGDLSLSGFSRQMGASLSQASLSLGRTLSMAAGDGGSTMDAMGKAMRSSSGSSSARFSSSSSRSSFSSSSSRSSSSRSSSSGRSSSSRSSGGGGSRGFR